MFCALEICSIFPFQSESSKHINNEGKPKPNETENKKHHRFSLLILVSIAHYFLIPKPRTPYLQNTAGLPFPVC